MEHNDLPLTPREHAVTLAAVAVILAIGLYLVPHLLRGIPGG